MGSISRYQRCQTDDRVELLAGADGAALFAVRLYSPCAALPAGPISGEVQLGAAGLPRPGPHRADRAVSDAQYPNSRRASAGLLQVLQQL